MGLLDTFDRFYLHAHMSTYNQPLTQALQMRGKIFLSEGEVARHSKVLYASGIVYKAAKNNDPWDP